MPIPLMKSAHLNPIQLEPSESFTCVDWKVPRPKEYSTALSFHLDHLLVASLAARGTVYVGDNIEPFRDGEILLLGPKVPVYWMRHPDENRPIQHVVTATFGERFAGGVFEMPEAEKIRKMLARSSRGILFPRSVYDRVIPDLLRATHLKGWERVCLFFSVLGRLATARNFRLLASPGFSSELEAKDIGRLSTVCQYVHDSYGEEISESQAAKLAGFSRGGFSRFFHERLGRTFVSYVTEVRISEACRRLAESDSTIVQIALETGFNHLSNFNRHFQKVKGMTPREYRRRYSEILTKKQPSVRRKKSAPAPSRRK